MRRGVSISKWGAPGAALLLIPKCPLCIVAYVAAVTGLGISFSTAQYLRYTLVTAVLSAVAYVAVRKLHAPFRAKVLQLLLRNDYNQ